MAISTPPNWPMLPTLCLGMRAWTRDQKTHSGGPKLSYYSSQPMHLQLSIKLLRKIGSFTQVNTEILIITAQGWKGQVLIPILEMRKWRNRGEMTRPISQSWLDLPPRTEICLPADQGSFCSASEPVCYGNSHWGQSPSREGVGALCHSGPVKQGHQEVPAGN